MKEGICMFRCLLLALVSVTALFAQDAARKMQKLEKGLELKRKDLVKAARFIEKRVPSYLKKQKYYLPAKETGLKHDVECDERTKACFIVLKGKKAFLGEGACKTVHKAIQYHPKKPKIVARATQKANRSREHQLTQELHGKRGLFQTVGFGSNKKKGNLYRTIYSKVYSPGSLHDVLENDTPFSIREKMKIAAGIISGLASLHEEGIVHRDLGARNYLIDIPKGKVGNRAIQAHIADFGRATYAERAADTKVQGNTKYTSPEGLVRNKMKGKHYYKSDIFAVGCVLYWLYHGQKPSWLEKSYIKDGSGSNSHRFHQLRWRVDHAIKKRRDALKGKVDPKKTFERLILQMLHTNPKARPSAKRLSYKMDKLIGRVV